MSPPLRVCIVDMQPITPAIGGGRLRLLGLYHDLGPGVVATYVGSYDWPGESLRDLQLTPGLREICVPLSDAHHAAAAALARRLYGATVIDSVFSIQAHLSPAWIARASAEIAQADVVVFSHPWCYPPLRHALKPHHTVVYDSQNVESVLKASLLGLEGEAGRVVEEVVRAEYQLARGADLVIACSSHDIDLFSRLFEVPRRAMRLVPNGTFTRRRAKPPPTVRNDVRHALGLAPDAPLAVFVGSGYGPNVEAARWIVDVLCHQLPDTTFLVVGGVGDVIDRQAPANVRVTGVVDDEHRDALLFASDLAVNPMSEGSGTNVKMFDFLAAGLPVVTTETGARGICDETTAPPFIRVRPLAAFPQAIAEVLHAGAQAWRDGSSPQAYVDRLYSWERISRALGELLCEARRVHQARETQATRPRAWMFGTWNIRCGIAEHASYFADALVQGGADVLVVGNRLAGHPVTGFEPDMRFPVTRAWVWDNIAWQASGVDFAAVEELLRADRPEFVFLQHHTAFMPAPSFHEAMRRFKDAGARVAVEFHDARHVPGDAFAAFAAVADLFVLHDDGELECVPPGVRHKCLVQALPVRPVGATPVESPRPDAGPVIAGFGFLRPYKGVLTAIGTIAALRERFPGVRYRGLHAVYGEESNAHLAECIAEAEHLGVADRVHIDTAFHDLSHVVAQLRAADIVLLPYAPSDEGASAAVNCALAAGRATVVSSARIFRPVASAAAVVEHDHPLAYADALDALLRDPASRARLEQAAARWAHDNSYDVASRRILDRLRTGPIQ